MTDIAVPSGLRSLVRSMRLVAVAPAQFYRSPFDGTLQTGDSQGPRWEAYLELHDDLEEDEVAEIQALIMKLRGQAKRLLLPYYARPVPRGTINLTGVTVNGPLSAGATKVTLAGCGNAKTLLTGDLMKLGDQVVMVVNGPYTSTSGGAMTDVEFEYPLRAAVDNGSSVTLNAPTIKMVLKQPSAGWSTRSAKQTRFEGLEFEEAFQ